MMGWENKDKDGNLRTDETREVVYQRGATVKQSFSSRVSSQWKVIQFWITVIVTISAIVVYVSSFAKSSDVNAKLEKINTKIDAQREGMRDLAVNVELTKAEIENLSFIIHRFIKGVQ